MGTSNSGQFAAPEAFVTPRGFAGQRRGMDRFDTARQRYAGKLVTDDCEGCDSSCPGPALGPALRAAGPSGSE